MNTKLKGGSKTVRTGRPTEDPKGTQISLRLSDNDLNKLTYCQEQTGKPRAQIIRQGIDRVYQSLLEEEKQAQK